MDKFETMVQTYEHKRQVSWNITNIIHDLLLKVYCMMIQS